MALAFLLPAPGCSRPETPREPAEAWAADDFSTVVGRIEGEAKAASAGESTIRVGPPGDEVDGRRTLTASRVGPTSNTNYTLQFRRQDDRWVCCGATAEEVEAGGGKFAHRLGGGAIEVDQLILWLGWRSKEAPGEGPPAADEAARAGPPLPRPTQQDVERIVLRDFGRERLAEVLDVLNEYGRREGTRPPSPRVHLAILRFAEGDLARLREFTEIACGDFRDVVGPAEAPYPHFLRRPEGMTPGEEARANREQYLEWLARD
ncbi:MAG: hypothetical protein U0800_24265 [Isosphaeraceae bacterium]